MAMFQIEMSQFQGEQRLDGKLVIITGSNTGIGKETAKAMASRGARVILACRNLQKGQTTALEIQNATGNDKVKAKELDRASFKSINQFVEDIKKDESKLDILINNAGIFFIPHALTEDGFETVFQTNYLGHFLLSLQFLDLLKAAAPSRIINVSSHGHSSCKRIKFEDLHGTTSYSKFQAYTQSKLAQLFFTQTLSRKLKGTGITVNAVTPGNVKTDIFRDFPLLSNRFLRFLQWPIHYFIFKTPEEGAQTTIYTSTSKALEEVSGKYYSNCAEATPSATLRNTEMEQQLWDTSLELIGKTEDDLAMFQ